MRWTIAVTELADDLLKVNGGDQTFSSVIKKAADASRRAQKRQVSPQTRPNPGEYPRKNTKNHGSNILTILRFSLPIIARTERDPVRHFRSLQPRCYV